MIDGKLASLIPGRNAPPADAVPAEDLHDSGAGAASASTETPVLSETQDGTAAVPDAPPAAAPAKPKKRSLSLPKFSLPSWKPDGNGSASSLSLPGPLAALFEKIRARFAPPDEEIDTLFFDVGALSEPSMEGALSEVDLVYEVDPPFQYVHIRYDTDERALFYHVIEPELSDDEKVAFLTIEKAFEKMICTNVELIAFDRRIEFLRERYDATVRLLSLKLSETQKERIFFHLKRDYVGYGRIDTLMKDRFIEDVSCNGSNIDLYVQHRVYGPIQTSIRFEDVELNNFVLRLAQASGRHISLLQPIRDVTLPDGSRGNLTLGGEVTKRGSTFTIRKFRSNPISAIELMDYGTVNAEILAYLWILMEYKRSILVSGGTASGKTTFLNILCSFIPTDYKIVSIEDTAELNLMHPNWLQSITRTGFGATAGGGGSPSGIAEGGKAPGDIALYDLLIAALRQRPEYILVGEVRGAEAFTLFQAIAVGHAAMGTIHAGTMDELLSRIESNPMNVPRSLFCNLDAIVFPMQIRRGERSIRRIANIVEILEIDHESGDLITNTACRWRPEDDVFKFSGRSYLSDKIRETFGVSKEFLAQEQADRTELLIWMQKHRIRDYHEVLRMIRAYARDKDRTMAQIREDAAADLQAAD
ncbi:MAG: archaeal flagellar protein FlaI [Methanofollis sp.]|nr:archaeal flagellar protein FlaI [Methanofollis sp.]